MRKYKKIFKESLKDPSMVFDKIVELFYADNGGEDDPKTSRHFKEVKPKAIKLISRLLDDGVDFTDELLDNFTMGEYDSIMDLYDGNEQIEVLGHLIFDELF
jgi:hypothetical protein